MNFNGANALNAACPLELRVIDGDKMDVTNRIVKLCRRITDIEHALACKDQSERETVELSDELEQLESELKTLQPAI